MKLNLYKDIQAINMSMIIDITYDKFEQIMKQNIKEFALRGKTDPGSLIRNHIKFIA